MPNTSLKTTFKTEQGTGDKEEGLSLWVTNEDADPSVQYVIYENSCDGHPWKYASASSRRFVQVCDTASANNEDKVHNLGTWFEVDYDAKIGHMWGNISFLEGCDDGGNMATTD
ncbi:uncharacterized protein BCR38DRAFT_485322 [Pseudomassariella vexata]|uniref:Uncharacterized protein n=1 Tax=Pseudomassariella vexata TaxID=1141098 RepID=A0A1Y2DY72_9PEZI|nr:uncharacterized protein BCR38DRAFT_485322 [Pseudomassariella vexata]ORY64187.1 hypothetical protein BCR38DRAFT_485322 [Pseudomassariella vexata]